jgi:hypothetical protein
MPRDPKPVVVANDVANDVGDYAQLFAAVLAAVVLAASAESPRELASVLGVLLISGAVCNLIIYVLRHRGRLGTPRHVVWIRR